MGKPIPLVEGGPARLLQVVALPGAGAGFAEVGGPVQSVLKEDCAAVGARMAGAAGAAPSNALERAPIAPKGRELGGSLPKAERLHGLAHGAESQRNAVVAWCAPVPVHDAVVLPFLVGKPLVVPEIVGIAETRPVLALRSAS